jgi:hypothetical protein
MRLYYDEITGDAKWTYDGSPESAPQGAYVELAGDPPILNGLKVVNGQPVYMDLLALKREVVAKINARAGAARATFITVLPGQDMLYLEKRGEAVAYVAANPDPTTLGGFPLLAAEVGPGLTAPTAYQLAQIWLYMGEQWKLAAGQIETARLGAVYAVEAAATEAEIAAIEAAYVEALS